MTVDLPHFILFDQLNVVRVRRVAFKLHGAAGPSGLDVLAWRRVTEILVLRKFRSRTDFFIENFGPPDQFF